MTENYLDILEESLKNKIEVLNEIKEYNEAQERLLKQEAVPMDEFDAFVDKKDGLIKQLTDLDEGFELLYNRIKEELESNKDMHKDQIKSMQGMIKEVTDLSVSIQVKENSNKKLVEKYFEKLRSGLKQDRKSSKAAYDYYKKVSSSNVPMSRYLDQKK